MIVIRKSTTADTRTCDHTKVSKHELLHSSIMHIDDVRQGTRFFIEKLYEAAQSHDADKITDIDGFYRDFQTGFEKTEWWDRHRKINRHHLQQEDGVPEDVNLLDVLEMIADCVMAGMARSGSVYPPEISDDVLRRAFDNTVDLLKSQVRVHEGLDDPKVMFDTAGVAK